jgi:predicted dehydrogenase
LRVILHASTLVAELGPRWTAHGTAGSFTKFGLDGQEDALKLGQRPQLSALQDWGVDPRPGEVLSFKTVPGLESPVTVRRAATQPQGNYLAYYAQLRDHLWGLATEPPVTPRQVHAVMQLLTLGEKSAEDGCWLPVTTTQGKVQPA